MRGEKSREKKSSRVERRREKRSSSRVERRRETAYHLTRQQLLPN
jgi:hypothetical protein